MPKDTEKSRPRKGKKELSTTGQVYWLQIGFDAEEKQMLDALVEDKRLPAGMMVRQLILAEYRKLKP